MSRGKAPRGPRRPSQNAATARLQQATNLHRQGRLAEAATRYREILSQFPAHFDALHWLGVLELQMGNTAAAADLIGRAIAADPGNAAAHANLGNALRNLGQPEAALTSYDRALALRPAFPEALYNRGNALRDLKRPGDALASYDCALAIKPAFPEALANRGNALQDLKRYEDALASQDRALALRPDMAEALFNRGNALRELNRPEEALASYDRALAINPRYLEPLSNRGNALLDLKRYDDALASFARVLALAPDNAGAHWNESIARLLLGDFERGWKEYEWRWQHRSLGFTWRPFTQPQWTGAHLDGVLLAWGEQGLGDQILYLGMLHGLAERARQLIVAVDARLVPLIRRSFPRVTAVPLERSITEMQCDAHVPLGSIGQHLRRTWNDFPGNSPGKSVASYLIGDDRRTRELRARVARNGEVVCGLSWFSGSERSGQFKSMTLRELQPVLDRSGIRFVDLQYGDTREEREALEAGLGSRIVRIEDIDNRNDIEGLAALIGACDVVVTVSNVTAHLAGALGKPVHLMLPYSRGRLWYWHEDRDDSPWYPTVRLFRQPAHGDWASVIQRVMRAL